MYTPRFIDHLESSSSRRSSGDAFQEFVHELLLHDYPDLHVFPGGGKDGGIDLVQTTAQPQLVVECKYIGNDDAGEAQQRWNSVAKNLTAHLADPAGPTKGQAQYQPWYRVDPPINQYIFCVSSRLAGQKQFAELRDKIEQFFVHLGTTHGHLAHLAKIKVTVLDWNDLHDRLRRHPHVMFRWFPLSRPQGLVPLDEIKTRSTFRSYLFGDKLEYYARRQHLQLTPAPPSVNIPDEEALLNQLEGDNITGLIVTGGGGVGKTRLTLELGSLARRQNWTVLRVLERLKDDTIQLLAERIQPDVPVLLLIDYVETQRDFEELIESLNAINDTYNLRLRYVANCRTSYYRAIASLSRHQQINLSPVAHEAALGEWLESYQQSAVRHILERSGLEITDSILRVCHGLPVLAVFVSYLHTTGRQPELEALMGEQDFANWVYMRVKLSFGASFNPRDLALFISLFPLSAAVASRADLGQYGALLDTLAADGWIEKTPPDESHEGEQWEVAHDVLADRIVLSYFATVPRTIDRYVHELFSLARRVGSLRSAFTAMQRVADHPLVKSLDWLTLLNEELREDPASWRSIRDLLLRTPLLNVEQIIGLLGEHEEVWEGAEAEPDFQNALGWQARWLQGQEKETGTEHPQRPLLTSWIRKAAPHASTSNFVLTRGLQFCPEAVMDSALDWIRAKPRLFQTHYLMVAWLDTGLPLEAIANSVEQWATSFYSRYQLSFVIRSWLDRGGDPGLIRQPMLTWLNKHRLIPDAKFVFQAWLNAGGDKELVRSAIKAWLAVHQAIAEASYIYPPWLNAGGDKELVQASIQVWLHEHPTTAEADYVYRGWLNAGGDKELVRAGIEAWLLEHRTTIQAGYIYGAWLNAGGDKELVQAAIKAWLIEHRTAAEADYVYHSWLYAGGNKDVIRESLDMWLREHGEDADADFIYKAWLETGGEFSLVRPFAIEWLSLNHDKAEAVYLTKFMAPQADIPIRSIKNILYWCRKFATNEDALWRLFHLRRHYSNPEAAEEICSTAEVVFQHIFLSDASSKPEIKNLIASIFSFLITQPSLRAETLRERIDALLLAWLRHPSSYGTDPPPHVALQRVPYVRRVASLLKSGALNVADDRAALERFFRWVNAWEFDNKEKVEWVFADLKTRFPASDLWDIVKFE